MLQFVYDDTGGTISTSNMIVRSGVSRLDGLGCIENMERVSPLSIGLITDSAADLPVEIAASHGIEVVPLIVHLGSETFHDGVDMSTEDFFARIAAGNLAPKTSQPSVGDFIEIYRKSLAKHHCLISIHLASNLSGTYETAVLAQRALPGEDITVVDARSVSMGLGLQVLQAARALAGGMDKDGVLGQLEASKREVEVLVAMDSLEYLERGGRIGKVSSFLGTLLRIKPLIQILDGQILPLAKTRSREQALEALLDRLEKLAAGGRVVLLSVIHTAAPKEAGELAARIKERVGPVELITEAGQVLGAHAGPRCLGVAVLLGACPSNSEKDSS